MYSTSHPVSTSMNGMNPDIIDGSGTINPAALNTPVSVLPTPTSIGPSSTSPRGRKRSRSPEGYGDVSLGAGQGDDDDSKPRKRGRPPKPRLSGGASDLAATQTLQQTNQAPPVQLQTPQLHTRSLPVQQQAIATPVQTSPPKATPTKTVVKALPTVRDHTTDQLSPDGDEYIPREYDEAGEKKVSPTGRPLEGREYKCRTFLVPNRGDKLFMLATECARVLGYRDSYLLFNKNRSLYKIIATQPEKDDLIQQEILPYSYRSRQIAIVTAKSMFRQFGSRVIQNGRRVRDDYWEAKARKQGFTEEDMAGEKRPGQTKAAREAQAADAAANAVALGHHQDVVYTNPGTIPMDPHGQLHLMPSGMGGPMSGRNHPLPMIQDQSPSDGIRLRSYDHIARPTQEIAGASYHDRTQPTSATEILNQAAHTAEYSKALNEQSRQRGTYMKEFWVQSREGIPVSTPLQQPGDSSPAITHPLQSPPTASTGMMSTGQQPLLQHQTSQMMNPQSYTQQPHQQNPLAPSPIRNLTGQQQQQQLRPDHHQRHNPTLTYPQQPSSYTYSTQSQMWGHPPPQPHQQQSPLSAQHTLSQYPTSQQQAPSQQQQQQQPPHRTQHSPSPHHPSQSPHQQQQQQQQQQPVVTSSMHPGLNYQGLQMGQQGYGAMGRQIYPQPNQSQHAYLQQTSAGGAAGLQGWAPTGQGGQGGQGHAQGGGGAWQGY